LDRSVVGYKIRYDGDADALAIIVKEKGKLSHAEEVGDIIVHFDTDGKPFFMKIPACVKVLLFFLDKRQDFFQPFS
jgi:hypothetical protein